MLPTTAPTNHCPCPLTCVRTLTPVTALAPYPLHTMSNTSFFPSLFSSSAATCTLAASRRGPSAAFIAADVVHTRSPPPADASPSSTTTMSYVKSTVGWDTATLYFSHRPPAANAITADASTGGGRGTGRIPPAGASGAWLHVSDSRVRAHERMR